MFELKPFWWLFLLLHVRNAFITLVKSTQSFLYHYVYVLLADLILR